MSSKNCFNSAPVICADWQKHLQMYLDKALNFNLHIKEKMFKATKGIRVIHKTQQNSSPSFSHYNKQIICETSSTLW